MLSAKHRRGREDPTTGLSGGWATHQLAEFVGAVSGLRSTEATVRGAIERTAEALEAEAAAAVGAEAVGATFGFGRSQVPERRILEAVEGRAQELVLDDGTRYHAAVSPIGSAGVGSILVARRDERFDPEEVNFLRAAGKILAQTLTTIQTIEAERAQRQISEERRQENERLLASLRERQRLFERLSSIQSSIVSRMEISETLEAIVTGAAKLIGDEMVALRLVDEEDPSRTQIVASHGIDPANLEPQRLGRVGEGAGGRAISEGRLVVLEDYEETESAIDGWIRNGVTSAMAAPVSDAGVPIGSLVIATSTRGRTYTLAEREILTAFAKHASLALTDAKTVEAAVHEGLHDSLTGLPNRSLLIDRLEHALARAERGHDEVAVLFLDLDGFKTINDSLGHAAGDEMLAAVARRIETSLRPGDTAARFGGDEFVVLLDHDSGTYIGGVAERLLAAFEPPFRLRDQELFASCSIGIAIGSDPSQDLLRDADLAMYEAKAAGPGNYAIFEQEMHSAVKQRLAMVGDLKRAIRDDSLVVHYQPIWNLRHRRIEAVEALVRWQHPVRGMLGPGQFISLAEETGAIIGVGTNVLRQAISDVSEWRRRWPVAAELGLNVNVSLLQLQQPGLSDVLGELIEGSELSPTDVVLELTETVLAANSEEIVARLEEITALGFSFAVDDFGTGYSSLAQLSRFPVSALKIPKEFTDDVVGEGTDSSLARAIVDIGASLGLEVVAEGIEQVEQIHRLIELGCDLGQGFYLARPLTATVFEGMLSDRDAQRAAAD